MPTHIYTRLGSWQEVVDGNLKAADAALEYPAGDKDQYVWDEFPHAIEYLVYAYLQQGNDSEAAAQLKRLTTTENLQPTFKTAFHLSSIPARHALESKNWREAAELVPRQNETLEWDRYPWAESVTWFAKGLGYAHLGRMEDARRAHDRLVDLERVSHNAGEELFTLQIRMLRLAVSAWISHVQGNEGRAIRGMDAAAKLEITTPKPPVTPAAILPAYELMGDLLMELKKTSEALAAYKHSLELYPNRFNSLLGAARASKELGDGKMTKKYYAMLLMISANKSNRAGALEARNYMAGRVTQQE